MSSILKYLKQAIEHDYKFIVGMVTALVVCAVTLWLIDFVLAWVKAWRVMESYFDRKD